MSAADPLSTAAERCMAGVYDAQLCQRLPNAANGRPVVLAPRPGWIAPKGKPHLFGGRAFYFAPDGLWRDTLTDTQWEGVNA